MRISDWSSDVCSSDLKGTQVDFGRAALIPAPAPNIVIDDVPVGLDGARQQILERASPQHAGPMIADDVRQLVRFEVELLHRQPEMIAERLAQMPAPGRRGDRKSVGEGKSVSVRVDLGGRSMHKKKNKEQKQTNRT